MGFASPSAYCCCADSSARNVRRRTGVSPVHVRTRNLGNLRVAQGAMTTAGTLRHCEGHSDGESRFAHGCEMLRFAQDDISREVSLSS